MTQENQQQFFTQTFEQKMNHEQQKYLEIGGNVVMNDGLTTED